MTRRLRVGITLPQFRPDVESSLAAAVAAEEAGLDGAFVFDHVWSIGRPDRPALSAWPLLGALAAETGSLHLGPLVARIGLLPDAVLVHELESLHRIAGDRLIAGLGTGDHLSRAENEAVGVPFAPAAERLAALRAVCGELRALEIPSWIGGRSTSIHETARSCGAALNLWGAEPAAVAAVRDVEVTWGGMSPPDPAAVAALLQSLADAGATWAVIAPPYGTAPDPVPAVEMVAEAVATLR